MKHVNMKNSLDSQLQIDSICFYRILNTLEVMSAILFGKNLKPKINAPSSSVSKVRVNK